MSAENHLPETRPPSPPKAGWMFSLSKTGRKFVWLVLWFGLFFVLRLPLDQTAPMERARVWGYTKLLQRLKPALGTQLPVKIVDVTKMPHRKVINNPSVTAIDRVLLLQVLTKIAAKKPRAIGVDYNFALEADGTYVTNGDPDFFTKVDKLSASTRVPIFLGVFPRPGSKFQYFIGKSEDKLTAAIPVHRVQQAGKSGPTEIRDMPLWWQYSDRAAQRTMVAALIGASFGKSNSFEPPFWMRPWLAYYFDTAPSPDILIRSILVDYSILPLLMDQRVASEEVLQGTVAGQSFSGAFVLLGDATPGKTSNPQDAFLVPASKTKVPGVYLHACATYSALQSPLYKLTASAMFWLDVVLCLTTFGLALGLAELRHLHTRHEWLLELGAVIIISVLVFGATYFLVTSTRTMCEDFAIMLVAMYIDWATSTGRDKCLEYRDKCRANREMKSDSEPNTPPVPQGQPEENSREALIPAKTSTPKEFSEGRTVPVTSKQPSHQEQPDKPAHDTGQASSQTRPEVSL